MTGTWQHFCTYKKKYLIDSINYLYKIRDVKISIHYVIIAIQVDEIELNENKRK